LPHGAHPRRRHTLAFAGVDRLPLVRLGVLAGSLLSAAMGYGMLRASGRKQ